MHAHCIELFDRSHWSCLETNNVVQKDFERWYTLTARQQHSETCCARESGAAATVPATVQTAGQAHEPAAQTGRASHQALSPALAATHRMQANAASALTPRASLHAASPLQGSPANAVPVSNDTRFGVSVPFHAPCQSYGADTAYAAGATKQHGAHAPGPSVQAASTVQASARQRDGASLQVDWSQVPDSVLQIARPFLTGNVQADQDIVSFYVARQQLLDASLRESA